MSEALSRERTLELLSEYREGSLEPALRDAVAERLAADAECRETLRALDELEELLGLLAAAPEPRAGLAARAARAALAAGRPRPATVVAFRPRVRHQPAVPAQLQAAAAVAMLVVGLAALVTGPEAAPQQAATRFVERTRLELRQQGGRFVENLRELREIVGAAVETRLDRVEDRVDDYRRLLLEESAPAPSEGRGASPAGVTAELAEPWAGSMRTGRTSAEPGPRQIAGTRAPRRTA